MNSMDSNKEYLRGEELERKGSLEEAYEAYKSAAENGNAEAMFAIAKLYLFKDFHKVKVSNLMQLIQQGLPVFPWNLQEHEEPDYKSALEWSLKAFENGNAGAALIAGEIYCKGLGLPTDTEKGLSYIKNAVEKNVPGAKEMYAFYCPPKVEDIDNSEYEEKLKEFVDIVENNNLLSGMTLYSELKNGTSEQKAKFGYVLMKERYRSNPLFASFPVLLTETGIPIIPAAPKRVQWRTFIRIDKNAFPKDAKILFSSDLSCNQPDFLKGLKAVGNAEYISSSFGWLGENKYACILEFDDETKLSEEELEQTKQCFMLNEVEYQPKNIAFFVENGEKEYSVEIAALVDERIDVLYRYTIGGSDTVKEYVEPKLTSITYNEER